MREYSEVKKDIYGDSYVETRDESGRLVQIVKANKDFFGDEYYDTYDSNMRRIGYSRLEKDFYGDSYMATYDNSGRLVRTSVEKTDFLGNKYLEIRDAAGRAIGNASAKTDFFGNAYTETNYNIPAGQGGATASAGAGTDGRSGSGSHSGGGDIGAGIGCVFGFGILFALFWFFTTLHDYEGREKIHRFVMVMSFLVPLALVFWNSFKLRGIGGFLKNRMIVISCALILVSQSYYLFYTSHRMEWILESDLAYYGFWFLPYTLFYGYSFLTAVFAREAAGVIPDTEIESVLDRLYYVEVICFALVAGLMLLRWEMYASKAVWGRTLFEIMTIAVVMILGICLVGPGTFLVDKMTGRVRRRA